MNLAIQRLQQFVKETEVQLQQATDAHKAHERTAAESAARVVSLTALLADLRAAVTALPVAALKAVQTTAAPAPKPEHVPARPEGAAVPQPPEAKTKKR
jgi:hypothetical protein